MIPVKKIRKAAKDTLDAGQDVNFKKLTNEIIMLLPFIARQ